MPRRNIARHVFLSLWHTGTLIWAVWSTLTTLIDSSWRTRHCLEETISHRLSSNVWYIFKEEKRSRHFYSTATSHTMSVSHIRPLCLTSAKSVVTTFLRRLAYISVLPSLKSSDLSSVLKYVGVWARACMCVCVCQQKYRVISKFNCQNPQDFEKKYGISVFEDCFSRPAFNIKRL